MRPAELARRVVAHFRAHARDLPWRRDGLEPYAVWVCEVMAQQTRIAVVIPYWERWLARFPTVAALAAAAEEDVLALWAGLGYYARARALHAAARRIVDEHGGVVPDTVDVLVTLPGVGPYTAGAIASIAYGRRAAAVDGNVARILARLHGIEEDVRAPATVERLWRLADELVPARSPGDFNQGLMDLGATICTPRSPACGRCPIADPCVARRDGRQDVLPVLRRTNRTPRLTIVAALVVDDEGRWLLGRRESRGLFGGLWELPEAAALGAVELARRASARHTQKLSHRILDVRVHRARLDTMPTPAAPYEAYAFHRPETALNLGISSATRALTHDLLPLARFADTSNGTWPAGKAGAVRGIASPRSQAELTTETAWPRPNARSRSSSRASRRSSKASAP